jgi:hypothetical protein
MGRKPINKKVLIGIAGTIGLVVIFSFIGLAFGEGENYSLIESVKGFVTKKIIASDEFPGLTADMVRKGIVNLRFELNGQAIKMITTTGQLGLKTFQSGPLNTNPKTNYLEEIVKQIGKFFSDLFLPVDEGNFEVIKGKTRLENGTKFIDLSNSWGRIADIVDVTVLVIPDNLTVEGVSPTGFFVKSESPSNAYMEFDWIAIGKIRSEKEGEEEVTNETVESPSNISENVTKPGPEIPEELPEESLPEGSNESVNNSINITEPEDNETIGTPENMSGNESRITLKIPVENITANTTLPEVTAPEESHLNDSVPENESNIPENETSSNDIISEIPGDGSNESTTENESETMENDTIEPVSGSGSEGNETNNVDTLPDISETEPVEESQTEGNSTEEVE